MNNSVRALGMPQSKTHPLNARAGPPLPPLPLPPPSSSFPPPAQECAVCVSVCLEELWFEEVVFGHDVSCVFCRGRGRGAEGRRCALVCVLYWCVLVCVLYWCVC